MTLSGVLRETSDTLEGGFSGICRVWGLGAQVAANTAHGNENGT